MKIRVVLALALILLAAGAPRLAGAWETTVNGTFDSSDSAQDVAVDSAGDVFAAGSTKNGPGSDFTVIKFSGATGTVVWQTELQGTLCCTNGGQALVVDTAGDVIAVGTLQNTGALRDFAVVKLDGSDGQEIWRRTIDGSGGADFATAITLTSSGQVLVAGAVQIGNDEFDIRVVKLSSVTGGVLWTKTIVNADQACSCTASTGSWTSTSKAVVSPLAAWRVTFSNGVVDSVGKFFEGGHHVRAVRGGL